MKTILALLALMFTGTYTVLGQDGKTITEIQIVNDTDYVYDAPDVLPEYPGGLNGLMDFLCQNIIYPTKAVEGNIQGKVLVKFVVNISGSVENVQVIEPVHPLLDEEAVRVVSLLRGFTPGQKDGKYVNTWYSLPISFKLNGDEKKRTETSF